MNMARMFETLRERAGRDPSRFEEFFSSHPSPGNRAARIQKEAALLAVRHTQLIGGFEQVQAELRDLPSAPSMSQIARGDAPRGPTPGTQRRADIQIEPPSSRLRSFEEPSGFFTISYPANWEAQQGEGFGVTIAPKGGIVQADGGQPSIVYGVVANHYDPFEAPVANGSPGPLRGRTALEHAANDLVNQIVQSNRHLRYLRGSERWHAVTGAPRGTRALSLVLSGRSPVTRQEERVTVYTRELPDEHVLYTLLIAAGRDHPELSRTFERMISSLQVHDEAVHR